MTRIGTIGGGVPATARPQLPARTNAVTVALGTWLTIGAFVDAWAHNNLDRLETFFTPWHALLYSGFAASSAWIGWQVWRRLPDPRTGRWDRAQVPAGYGLGLLGAGVFLIGGVGDMVWHLLLGVEVDIDALYSPTHLLLFAGVFLILTTPLRAAWWNPQLDGAPGLQPLLPALASLTLATSSVTFFFQYWSVQSTGPDALAAWNLPGGQDLVREGMASILVTNAILIAALLYLTRRWILPVGAATMMFAMNALLLGLISEYAFPGAVVGLIVGGVAADGVIAAVRPGPGRRVRTWLAGALAPAAAWSVYLAGVAATSGITWPPELWSGIVAWTALTGLALALLMHPSMPGARVAAAAAE